MSTQNPDFVLTFECARILGLSDERVRQLAKEGKLPVIRTSGGTRIFRRADVERLRRERERHAK